MTEITPFPENNYETVLLDRPFRAASFCVFQIKCKNRGSPHRGFCNKKRGEENEKEIIESFDYILPRNCEEKKRINIKFL